MNYLLAIALAALVALILYALSATTAHPECPAGYEWTPEGAKGGTCRRAR